MNAVGVQHVVRPSGSALTSVVPLLVSQSVILFGHQNPDVHLEEQEESARERKKKSRSFFLCFDLKQVRPSEVNTSLVPESLGCLPPKNERKQTKPCASRV